MLDQESQERMLGNDDRTKLIELLSAFTGVTADEVYIDDFGQMHLIYGKLRAVAYAQKNTRNEKMEVLLKLAPRSNNPVLPSTSDALTVHYYETDGIDYSTECTIIGHLVHIGCYNPTPNSRSETAA